MLSTFRPSKFSKLIKKNQMGAPAWKGPGASRVPKYFLNQWKILEYCNSINIFLNNFVFMFYGKPFQKLKGGHLCIISLQKKIFFDK